MTKKVQCPQCPKMLDPRGLPTHLKSHKREFTARSGSVSLVADSKNPMDDIVGELKGNCRRQLEAIAILSGVEDLDKKLSENVFFSNLLAV